MAASLHPLHKHLMCHLLLFISIQRQSLDLSRAPLHVQAAPMRDLCSSVLLQFVLDYPLGQRRLQQHLHFLLANLSFEHAGGRHAAAGTLRALSFKLPTPLLDTWAAVFFLPLVAQLVNEDDARCRGEISAAVQALFIPGGIQMIISEVVVAILLAVQFNAHSGEAISQHIGVAVIVFICLFVAGWAFMPLP